MRINSLINISKLKQNFILYISIILMIYGLTGFLLGLFIINDINDYKFGFETQSKELQNSVQKEFEAMSKTMEKASFSALNAGKSITSAKKSLYSAQNSAKIGSETIKDISPLLTRIGNTFNICFLTICPFQKEANWFYQRSAQLNELSSNIYNLSINIGETANNLETNSKDMGDLSKNLLEMSKQLKDVSDKFNNFVDLNPLINKFKQFTKLLVIWMIILHLIIFLIGLIFLLNL